jgi:hypothetical protein
MAPLATTLCDSINTPVPSSIMPTVSFPAPLFPPPSSTKALFLHPLFFTPDLRFAASSPWAVDLSIMAPCFRPVGPDDKSGSDASSDVRKIFSDNGSGDLELDSDYSDDDEDPDDSVDDEGQLPPEHYLTEAESLNVSQLRQKRYSDGTQEN